jgi:multisubunit Na+/H+ antiporter MnhC subunit
MKKLIGTTIVKTPVTLAIAAQEQVSQNQAPAPTPEEKAILDMLAK